ncbi:SDR family NAD(P)-dependent oxidoreductase [Hydrogenophaga sp.]|uniref:SDR family NAD(P)-dependent oxidoreductase n=1 Tax=Hydrogenophaga sp. TaxID=1904254 RepID=UPI002719FF37|nr:SDR family oxidoreductase [Hydrogenophaga sp.]MDO9439073.1 SDR family oxidoreductase [Hydrogenophaga sp.]
MTPFVSLENRTIIVTGAAQGIGQAATRMAIGLGANVVAVDMNEKGLAQTAVDLPAAQLMTVAGSVVDAALAERTVREAVARFGGLHGLVNNAGITRPAMIEKMKAEEWQQVIDVHLTGSFYWLQAAGRQMLAQARAGDTTGGSVIQISSDAGRKGSVGQINYAAAKAGMLGMTMTAAREWGKYSIRANSVCFGVVETPMTEVVRGEKFRDNMLAQIPLGRWSSPEEAVRAVCFLLSDAASYITGQHIAVNGGFHISL